MRHVCLHEDLASSSYRPAFMSGTHERKVAASKSWWQDKPEMTVIKSQLKRRRRGGG